MLETGLKRIITHGRAFSMMTGVIELDLSPTAKGSDQIIIQRNDQSQRVCIYETDALRSSPTREIQIDWWAMHARSSQLEQADTFTLKGRATFGLGIVTGNNKEQLRMRPADQDEAIYTGKEVQRYSLVSRRCSTRRLTATAFNNRPENLFIEQARSWSIASSHGSSWLRSIQAVR